MDTHILSAYPCLGKTTIGRLNKYNRVFEGEFTGTCNISVGAPRTAAKALETIREEKPHMFH